jgi:hypothetical protein
LSSETRNKHPSTDEQIGTLKFNALKYDSVIKTNDILMHATKWKSENYPVLKKACKRMHTELYKILYRIS